jgi:hypothetical protein
MSNRLASKSHGNTYFSDPSGIIALIFEAEADEHPPPPVPARVALLGSILRTDATALSICEDMVEKGRIARFKAERNMRGILLFSGAALNVKIGKMEHQISHSLLWRWLEDIVDGIATVVCHLYKPCEKANMTWDSGG